MSTREPGASPGPVFILIRSSSSRAWGVRADVSLAVAEELDRLAREEPPSSDLRDEPVHRDLYVSFVGGRIDSGPAFTFPDAISEAADVVLVEDVHLLERNFRGWRAGEIEAGASPVLAVVENGHAVSVCFCARRSEVAAEAGVETAEAFRGRGLGTRVTAAWALAVRQSGLIPLYSTSWTNDASLAVARKLGLIAYASDWSLSD